MTRHPDFDDVRDITIIGAGPVGLSTAFWAGMREASSRIIDSLPELGGQLTTLYPEKWIFDVPGHRRVLAKDLVAELREQALGQFDVPVHLETTAHEIAWEDDVVVLKTDKGDLRSRTVIVAGGHGAFEPKKLPVSDVDMTPWEGRGASYLVGEKKEFAGKRVVIVGGGDSAFDWVVNLLDTASEITLVGCDAVLLQLGFSTKLGPLKEWGFEISKGALVVDPLMRTSLDRVWACGDITTFDGKLKLIATGFAEAAIAVSQAVHTIRPDMKIQPAYSTNTGVPSQTPERVTPSYVDPPDVPAVAEGQV
jgi:thioredoxin reductase